MLCRTILFLVGDADKLGFARYDHNYFLKPIFEDNFVPY